VVGWARRDVLVVVASHPAIGKWPAIRVKRWRGGSHVTIDEAEKMVVRGEESRPMSIIYTRWLWHIAIGHLLDHWTRDRADSVLLLTQPRRSGALPGRARRGSPRRRGWTISQLIDSSIQFSFNQFNPIPARPRAVTRSSCIAERSFGGPCFFACCC
jgi:hypothetical protein